MLTRTKYQLLRHGHQNIFARWELNERLFSTACYYKLLKMYIFYKHKNEKRIRIDSTIATLSFTASTSFLALIATDFSLFILSVFAVISDSSFSVKRKTVKLFYKIIDIIDVNGKEGRMTNHFYGKQFADPFPNYWFFVPWLLCSMFGLLKMSSF